MRSRRTSESNRDIRFMMWSTAFVLTTIMFILLPGVAGSELALDHSKVMPALSLDLECFNGGVGFEGKCMCPMYTSGDKCENADLCNVRVGNSFVLSNPFTKQPRNISLDACETSPALLCCWRERLDQPIPQATDDAQRIKNMLEYYGPWTQNDKLMLDYFFGKEGTAFKHLKPTIAPEPSIETRIAFVIMIHNDFQARLPNMLNAIYRKRHVYMIHVDKTADKNAWEWINEYLDTFLKKHEANNIHLVKNRFHGAWGAVSLVYLELGAIIELLKLNENTGQKWDHLINLSAYDFPLKPIEKLESFLRTHKTNNFIEVLGKKVRREKRQSDLHLSCGRSILITNYSDNAICPSGASNWMFRHRPQWEYGEGSQWHIFTRQYLEYLVSSLDQIELLFSMKYTLIPDESFFQSSLLSSPFVDTLIKYNYRYLPWADQLEVMHKHVPHLRETDAFFVRKLIDPNMGDVIFREVLAPQL